MIHIEGIKDEMIANNLNPYAPTYPGEVVKDEIEYRGITQRQLSEVTGIAYSVVNEVLNGKRPMTVEYALLISEKRKQPTKALGCIIATLWEVHGLLAFISELARRWQ